MKNENSGNVDTPSLPLYRQSSTSSSVNASKIDDNPKRSHVIIAIIIAKFLLYYMQRKKLLISASAKAWPWEVHEHLHAQIN